MTTHDIDVWQRHFANMSKGKTRPDKYGHYFIGSVQTGGNKPSEPSIKFVTPMAHAVELAKSDLKHQEGDMNASRRAPKRQSVQGVNKKKLTQSCKKNKKGTSTKKKTAQAYKKKKILTVSKPTSKKTSYKKIRTVSKPTSKKTAYKKKKPSKKITKQDLWPQ